jgi:23S rRNA pseudouridine1911/1915/1917 synthase
VGKVMEVLYEDNHCIAVVKPAGVPVMPDSSGDKSMLDLTKDFLKKKYDKPGKVFIGLVHRLDRSTGGVMVFAKTSKGASRLSKQFREGTIKKTYMAVVAGSPGLKSGTLRDFIRKDKKNNKSFVVGKNTAAAKEAILEYKVLDEKKGFTMVEINLLTGRHHQIRVQFSNRGHVLYGDVKYGSPNKAKLGLWAAEIEFSKPVGGDRIIVRCEPDYLTEPWRRFS